MAKLDVNGRVLEVQADGATPLLYVLRDELGLNAAKFGCGLGQCGACTVLADGEAIFSCITPVSVLQGRKIRTVEGLGTVEKPGPMQQAFIEAQAAQCGYCIPGMMMRAQALLERNAGASENEIRAALQPHLCRCGTHMRIVHAVARAGELMRGKS
jgi:nicotinate dehydrogenase subunit A